MKRLNRLPLFISSACLLGASCQSAIGQPSQDSPGMSEASLAYYDEQKQGLLAFVACLQTSYAATRRQTPTNAIAACDADAAAYARLLPEEMRRSILQQVAEEVARGAR